LGNFVAPELLEGANQVLDLVKTKPRFFRFQDFVFKWHNLAVCVDNAFSFVYSISVRSAMRNVMHTR